MFILLIIAALLLAVCFVLNKVYEGKAGTTLKAGFFYNCLLGLFASVFFFALNGLKFEITLFSALMAALLTVLVVSYTLVGFKILSSGGISIYSIFLMSGGMTVPYIVGLLFLDEEFKLIRTLGLAVLIFAVALSNLREGEKKVDIKKLLMCVAVFLLNGCVSVVSKLHQIEAVHSTVSTEAFVMLSGIAKFFIAGTAFLVIAYMETRKAKGENLTLADGESEVRAETLGFKSLINKKMLASLLPVIVLAALVDGVSYYLQLVGAANLPASVLYPAVTGASMIFSVILDLVIFKVKPSKYVIISACLCFVGTLMFL
jgi:drug/metabolite transporter (DMT)-like permease